MARVRVARGCSITYNVAWSRPRHGRGKPSGGRGELSCGRYKLRRIAARRISCCWRSSSVTVVERAA